VVVKKEIDWQKAREHWAFQKMADPQPPSLAADEWSRDAIDQFVLARLREKGLAPAPGANRRTLIRRATFDLAGLPPTPEEIDHFLADDQPGAFERIVDRLLASPRYGERWARLWLDVVRYADSNGLDENLAYGNAWRYRDYVINAFSSDIPFDRLVLEQLAGDLLPVPDDIERWKGQLIATGFLAMGPKMLAEQDKEKLAIDIVDEQLDVTATAFLGMTVGCARCHDHKYDPIPTRDYYALAGIFRSTSTMENFNHVSRWRELSLATADEVEVRKKWQVEIDVARKRAKEIEADLAAGQLGRWRKHAAQDLLAASKGRKSAVYFEAESAEKTNLHIDSSHWGSPEVTILHTTKGGEQFARWSVEIPHSRRWRLDIRYASKESRPMRLFIDGEQIGDPVLGSKTGDFFPKGQRWEQVATLDLSSGIHQLELKGTGASIPHLDRLRFVPAGEKDATTWLPSDTGSSPPAVVAGWIDFLDRSSRQKDPLFGTWLRFLQLEEGGFVDGAREICDDVSAELAAGSDGVSPLLRLVVDGLPPESLREAAGRFQGVLSALDLASEKRPVGKDGKKAATLQDPELERLNGQLIAPGGPFGEPLALGEKAIPAEMRQPLEEVRGEITLLEESEPDPISTALGVADGKVGDLPVHIRGNHLNLAKEVTPRGVLEIISHCVPTPVFGGEESGRLELARWIVHEENPLTARVIVNRIWQGHFGTGIVETPSNFGFRGGTPSHPLLLDRLARDFISDGWSLKRLHRRILLSATWQQETRVNERAREIDPGNRLLWSQNRRRLEAELVRDALLAITGDLDLAMGGTLLPTANRGYVTNDQSGNQARYDAPRRAIYLPIIRNAMFDLFSSFDFNDPSAPMARRPSTIIAHQALFFLNSPLVLSTSERLAKELLGLEILDAAERIDWLSERLLGRRATAEEKQRAELYLAAARAALLGEAGEEEEKVDLSLWQSYCQAVLASNEFIYFD